jgi:hypothetical protein
MCTGAAGTDLWSTAANWTNTVTGAAGLPGQ